MGTMKYFLHDTNAFNDEKIHELYTEFGYEGLGLFYTILEKIALQEKPIKTKVLKSQLMVGKRLEKCWSFMEEIGILCSSNGDTFNKQLLNYSETYQIKKENNKKRILQWREKQDDKKNVTHSEHVRNAPKVKRSKVKRSKVKRSKESIEKEPTATHPLQILISQDYPNISKLKSQLTEKQAETLQAKFKPEIIKDILDSMENKVDLTKKYSSVNLTIQSWMKFRENKNGNMPHPTNAYTPPLDHP